MAWRRPGGKPLPAPMMVSLLAHTCVIRPQWVNTKENMTEVQSWWLLLTIIFLLLAVALMLTIASINVIDRHALWFPYSLKSRDKPTSFYTSKVCINSTNSVDIHIPWQFYITMSVSYNLIYSWIWHTLIICYCSRKFDMQSLVN